ncbi:MYXO-CTERM sorting domain-containing protein [Myxococcus vastator]|uniref:MYXO-CTERM sorting domain-containing protein n=1 Tax=Myxococcus vastator TaxID=2709664 RepID=UPI0013D83640|nr:MYXO-CTERM sorting domain-containing protein [Myxococcus vastator]
MRSLVIFSLCLGVATAARAEWDVTEVPGIARTVDVFAPGVYAVSTSTQTELYEDGIQSVVFLNSDVFGTFLSPAGCFAAVVRPGDIISHQNCRAAGNIIPPDPVNTVVGLRRVKHTSAGAGYASVALSDGGLALLSASAGLEGPTPWTLLSVDAGLLSSTDVLGVTETSDGVPHALFSVTGVSRTELLWYTGDRRQAQLVVPPLLTSQSPRTVDLFGGSGPHPIALFGNSDGLFRGQLDPAGTTFSTVLLPDSMPVSITSVDVNTGNGSVHGEGFGLAVGVGANGEPVVLGAVPASSADNAGTQWRFHPAFEGSALPGASQATPLEVSCIGSSFCLFILDQPGFNVVTYFNAHAPVLDVGPAPIVVNEAGTATARFIATDADFDAVRVSVDTASAPGADLIGVNIVERPDQLDVTLVSQRPVCKDEEGLLYVHASDGLASHDVHSTVAFRVVNTQGPARPTVSPLRASTTASGASRVFTAQPATEVCPAVRYVWAPVAGQSGAPLLSTDGGAQVQATFTPPDVLCEASGASYTYEVRGVDEGGVTSSAMAIFTVDVAPWGRPLVPFAPGWERTLTSGPGASVDVVPDALHTCVGTPGLPAVATEWRLSASGSGIPEGVTVRTAEDVAITLDAPVSSERLRIEAAECAHGTLSLTARNRIPVTGGGTQDSADAELRVRVEPTLEDVATGSLELGVVPSGDGHVDIALDTSLNCVDARALKARMFLETLSGEALDSAVVPVPGTWRPALPQSCTAEAYRVRGELFDDSEGPVREGGRAQVEVPNQPLPARLGELEAGALVARCGEGASATLTQTIPANACGDVAISWSQVAGPALSEVSLAGPRVTVSTQETGLEALVGQAITLRVLADAGGSNTATTDYVLPITSERFVDVRHTMESPTASEKGLVGVVVELRNTSECEVGGLRYLEQVDGLEWVPGSVKLDGVAVEPQAVDGGFRVEDLRLLAQGTRTLTYVGRSPLLSTPRLGGEMTLNGVPVSGDAAVPPPTSGCGCSGGGSGAAVFGLAALARVLRRRK